MYVRVVCLLLICCFLFMCIVCGFASRIFVLLCFVVCPPFVFVVCLVVVVVVYCIEFVLHSVCVAMCFVCCLYVLCDVTSSCLYISDVSACNV